MRRCQWLGYSHKYVNTKRKKEQKKKSNNSSTLLKLTKDKAKGRNQIPKLRQALSLGCYRVTLTIIYGTTNKFLFTSGRLSRF